MHCAGTFCSFKNLIPAQTIPLHTVSTVKGGQNFKIKKKHKYNARVVHIVDSKYLTILFRTNFEKMIYLLSVFIDNKERKLYRYAVLTPGVLII